MRARLVLVGPAVLALVLGACGTDLPKLPGQLAATANAKGESTAAAADMMLRPNVRYELAKGVTVDATTAKAYQFGDGSRAATAKLAKALGVAGAVHAEPDGGWSVGRSDKDVPPENAGSLYVSKAGGSFSMYWASTVTGSGCSVPPAEPNSSVASDDVASKPACENVAPASTTTLAPGTAATKAEARRIATDALEEGGVDLHDPKVTVESFDGSTFNVRFQSTIGGGAVDGFEQYVTVDAANKITSAGGFLGDVNSVGSYDLATLQRAVDRLNDTMTQPYATDGRESLAATDMVAPAATGSGGATPNESSPVQSAPADGTATPEPMPPVDATPTVVTLTKADVGLMLQGDSRGDMWLVPAYLFTTDKDDHVTAAAADDKYIEQPSPTTTPVDGGSGSGDSSGGSTGEGNTGDGTTVAPPVPPSNTNCSVVAAQAAGDNAGIDAQVCASSTSVKAGDKVVFTITAGDADRAFTDGPCGDGVLEEFGDGGDGTAHCAACATSVPDGPGKIERKREHTYTKAGAYTATFTITSGTTCAPSPKDSSATVSLRIAVS